ncbi:DUF4236 domain-containing protein [Planotetraspora sp. A-T 1434]|uniref:DUF4236 domain-containing protein n=1 Tax=Planotetraspora sp. A-T 1434 TaxID=2979219 RepID=UPI0021BDF19C|nr:DUF4236 domain-containing protein [Planotetraspora sp. A-T 1434]MCT9934640.1 DUF4236 domain-containing protein [Planotetraspora sp. A-T 1434]
MGWSYRKSIKMGPFRLNLSRAGVGHSYGGRGFRVTKAADGRRTVTVNLPGGFHWKKTLGGSRG